MDDARRQVLAAIDDAETLELLRAMVSYPSYCGDEGPLAEYLAGWLRAHGFETTLADAEPGRPNVVGTLPGTGGGASLMFNGHLDIDPLPLSYERDPWTCTIENGRMYGHGIRNMKGGDAAMLAAAAAIQRSGVRLRGDLIVACVVGELQGGIGTEALIRGGLVPHYAIVPEPTWLNVRTVHAGVLEFLVHVTGRSAGLDPKAPSVNAVEKMARVVQAIPGVELRHRPNPELPDLPRVRVGGIIGGLGQDYALWRPAYVPDRCTIAVDVRLLPDQTIESVGEDFAALFARLRAEDPELRLEMALPPAAYAPPWRAMKLAMPPLNLPRDDALVQTVSQIHREVLGRDPDHIGPLLPTSYAGADSGHLFAAGTRAINYGPTTDSPLNSYVDLEMLRACTRVLALSALDLCNADPPAPLSQ